MSKDTLARDLARHAVDRAIAAFQDALLLAKRGAPGDLALITQITMSFAGQMIGAAGGVILAGARPDLKPSHEDFINAQVGVLSVLLGEYGYRVVPSPTEPERSDADA